MTKLRIVFLILFCVAGSFIVAHVLYVNKFLWRGTSIHIFHSIDILSKPGEVKKLTLEEIDSTIDSLGSGTPAEEGQSSGAAKRKSKAHKLPNDQPTKKIAKKPSLTKSSQKKKNTVAPATVHKVDKRNFKDWLKLKTTESTAKQIAKNVFNDDDDLQECPKGGRALVGLMYVDQSIPEMEELEKQMSVQHGGTVEKGGWWKPSDCKPRAKTALILPYRNREQQLKIFLRHLHPVLQRQLIEYRIVVIEQEGQTPFNRAGLFNVGFKEALKLGDYNCFIFSDVDLLPEDDRNNYGCPTSPRHMSVAVDKFNYQLPYATIFGGVGAFRRSHFEKVNGFSNRFWGWGGEDDDLYNRISGKGFTLTRPSLKVGRYTMIKIHHFQSHGADPNRMQLLQNSLSRIESDGLSSLRYQVKEFKELPLVTIVTVNIERT